MATVAAAFSGFETYQLSGVEVTSQLLGRGSYATVLELEYMGLKCAGKRIHDVLLVPDGDVIRHYQSECHLLSRLKHPNIVQFIGVYFEDLASIPILVLEYLPTDLTSLINKYGILPEEASYSILNDVSLGLNYLHNQTPPIIHRDISSNNILLTSGLTAKISDLGVARILNLTPLKASRMTRAPGTPAYMPPEVMIANPNYDTSIDTFSFGILMIHVFCGKWPEPQIGQIRIEDGVMIPVSEAERRVVFLELLDSDHPLLPLILQCLSNCPQKRPNASEIVQTLSQMMERYAVADSATNQLSMLTKSYRPRKAVTMPMPVKVRNKVSDLTRSMEAKSRGGLKEKYKTKMLEPTVSREPPLHSKDDDVHCLPVYVAKQDYKSYRVNGLSFTKGDQFYIVKFDGCWWHVRSKVTGNEGYVPSYCMAKANDLEAQEWYFSRLNRKQAGRLLMMDPNQYASYIVRSSPNGYSISVRDTKKVRHYRIKHLGEEYFMNEQVKFKSIVDLVCHYQQNAGGLCVNLRHPCVSTIQHNMAGAAKHISVKWEIDHEQIQLVKKIQTDKLGESDMWEGLLNGTLPVTVKSLKPGSMPPSEFLREAELMMQFHNPHIVHLYAVCSKAPVYIVTELMKYGCLQEYLCDDRRHLRYPQLMSMASQVAAGMTYLEELNVIHRDLAARNILVGGDLVCKVSEFRFAQAVEGGFFQAPAETKFAVKWMAPEAALQKRFSIKSDVWSFGVVLHEIVTYGDLPYPGWTDAVVIKRIQEGYRMPQPVGCPDNLYEIMCACWSENVVSRPSFGSLWQQLTVCELSFEDTNTDVSFSLSASLSSTCKLSS